MAAKAGGPPKKKRGMSLTVLIEAGVIQEGAVLRYMKARMLHHHAAYTCNARCGAPLHNYHATMLSCRTLHDTGEVCT